MFDDQNSYDSSVDQQDDSSQKTYSLDEAIDKIAQKYGVPKSVYSRMIQQESGGDSSAVSAKGATSAWQIMPDTAKRLGIDPSDPLQAAEGGLRLLRDNYKQFRNRAENDKAGWMMAVAAYHAGPKNVLRDLNRGGYGLPNTSDGAITTRNHVLKIFNGLSGSSLDRSPFGTKQSNNPHVDVSVGPLEPVDDYKGTQTPPTNPTNQPYQPVANVAEIPEELPMQFQQEDVPQSVPQDRKDFISNFKFPETKDVSPGTGRIVPQLGNTKAINAYRKGVDQYAQARQSQPAPQTQQQPQQQQGGKYANTTVEFNVNDRPQNLTPRQYVNRKIAETISSKYDVPFDIAQQVVESEPYTQQNQSVDTSYFDQLAKNGGTGQTQVGGSIIRKAVEAGQQYKERKAQSDALLAQWGNKWDSSPVAQQIQANIYSGNAGNQAGTQLLRENEAYTDWLKRTGYDNEEYRNSHQTTFNQDRQQILQNYGSFDNALTSGKAAEDFYKDKPYTQIGRLIGLGDKDYEQGVAASRAFQQQPRLTDTDIQNAQNLGQLVKENTKGYGQAGSNVLTSATTDTLSFLMKGLGLVTKGGPAAGSPLSDSFYNLANQIDIVGQSSQHDGMILSLPSGPVDVGHIATESGKLVSGGVRLAAVTGLTGGIGLPSSVGTMTAFGVESLIANSDKPIEQQFQSGVQNIAMSAVFHGANLLGQAVEDGLLTRFFSPEAQKAVEALKGNVHNPEANARLFMAKLSNELTAVATVASGSYTVSKLSGGSDEDAEKASLLNTVLHGMFSTGKYGELKDLYNKAFRVQKGSRWYDFVIDPKNRVFDVTKQLPERALQFSVSTDPKVKDFVEKIQNASNGSPEQSSKGADISEVANNEKSVAPGKTPEERAADFANGKNPSIPPQPAQVGTEALVQDQPDKSTASTSIKAQEGKTSPQSSGVASTNAVPPVSTERAQGLQFEAPLRPSTMEGAKARIGELEEQRDSAHREANTDPLTGMANKRALMQISPEGKEIPDKKYIIWDVNGFKKVNDELGHDKGDELLKGEVKDAIRQAAQETDPHSFVSRPGGDEFVGVAHKDKAEQVAQRAAEIFGVKTFKDKQGNPFQVSLTGTTGTTLKEADDQLTEAKTKAKIAHAEKAGLVATDREGKPLQNAPKAEESPRNEHPVKTFVRHYKELGGGSLDQTMKSMVGKKMTDAETAKMQDYISNLEGGDSYEKANTFFKQVRQALTEESPEKKSEHTQQPPVPSKTAVPANKSKGFTESETVNKGYASLKTKLGEKGAQKYFRNVDKLINPNENTVVQYRPNGVVTKEGDKYTFHALADMDMKQWRVGFKSDVTDQFVTKQKDVDGYVKNRPVKILNKQGNKVKVQFLDGKKETPTVLKTAVKEKATTTPEKSEEVKGKKVKVLETKNGKSKIELPNGKTAIVKADAIKKYARAGLSPEEVQAQITTPEFKEAEAKSKTQKEDERTGLTAAQKQYVAKELDEYRKAYPDKAPYEGEKEILKDGKKHYPIANYVKTETIIVPDDGTFKINDLKQANRLHQRLTGKSLEKQPKEKLASRPKLNSDDFLAAAKPPRITKGKLADQLTTDYGEFEADIPISDAKQILGTSGGKLQSDYKGRFGEEWIESTLQDKKAFTDGSFAIVTDKAPGTGKAVTSPPNVDRVVKSALGSIEKPTVIKPVKVVAGKTGGVVEFDNGQAIQYKYYDLLTDKYPDLTFKQGRNMDEHQGDVILAYKGKDVVGLVMPVTGKRPKTEEANVNGLKKAADPESVEYLTETLPKAHSQDLYENGTASIDSNGYLNLNEEAGETLRRLWGTVFPNDSGVSFYAATHDRNQLKKLVVGANKAIKRYKDELGYTDDNLKGLIEVKNGLEALSKGDYGISYVFEDSLPHEEFHVEDLRAGRTTKSAIEKIKKSKFWNDPKFNRMYPGISDADKVSEMVAILHTDPEFFKGTPAEKKSILNAWADGIIEKHTDDQGKVRIDLNKFQRVAQYASEKSSEGSEVPDRKSIKGSAGEPDVGEGDKERAGSKPAGSNSGTSVRTPETFTPKGKEKLSQTPKSLREKADIPIEDRTYQSVTNADQQTFADKILDKGLDDAQKWFKDQIDDQNGNNGATTVVGLNLINALAKKGRIKEMNKVADGLVPFVTSAAQSVQAMSIVSMFDPERAVPYAVKISKQATGKDLTPTQVGRATDIARRFSETAQTEGIGEVLQKQLENHIKELEQEKQSLADARKLAEDDKKKLSLNLDKAKKTIADLRKRVEKNPRVANKALVKEIESRKDEIMARIREAFPSGLKRAADNGLREAADTIPKDALIDWSILNLADNMGKKSVGEFKNELNELTNGQLTEDEINSIHAEAVSQLTSTHPRTQDQIVASKIRNAHLREAKRYKAKKEIEPYIKNLGTEPSKLVTNIINEGLKGGYTDEAIWFALARKTLPNHTDALKALAEQYPESSFEDKKRIMKDADAIFNKSKDAIKESQIANQYGKNLTEKDIENIKEERRVNQSEARKVQNEANKFYGGLATPTSRVVADTVVNVRRANLLTGIKTHLRNIVGNTVFGTTEETARPLSWLADVAASGVTGERTVDFLNPKAVTKGFHSLVGDDVLKSVGRESGIKHAMEILRHGDSLANKEEQQHLDNMIGEKFPKMKWMDSYVNGVFRTMGAEDALYKTYAFERSLIEQAKTQAITEHRRDKTVDIKKRTRELLQRPTEVMILTADDWSKFATFNNDNALSGAIAKFKKLHPAIKFGVETLMPYDRTPTNIILRVIEHTPAGFIISAKKLFNREPTKKFRNRYHGAVKTDLGIEGKPTKEQLEAIDQSLRKLFTRQQQADFAKTFGRAGLGSSLFALGFFLAAGGLLAGSMQPEDEDKKETNEYFDRLKKGVENRSLRLPGVGRFVLSDDPAMKVLTSGATFYEQMQMFKGDTPSAVWHAGVETTKDIVGNQPLANSLGSVYQLFNKGKYGEFTGNILGGYVPTMVSDIGEVGDEKARTASGYQKGQKRNNIDEELNFQMRGFKNSFLKRVPVARNYFVDESQSTVPQEERGDALRRAVRAIDLFNTRSDVPYKVKGQPSPEEFMASPEYKHADTDTLVDIIKMDRDRGLDTSKLELGLKKKALSAWKGKTLKPDEVERIKSVLPDFELKPRTRK